MACPDDGDVSPEMSTGVWRGGLGGAGGDVLLRRHPELGAQPCDHCSRRAMFRQVIGIVCPIFQLLNQLVNGGEHFAIGEAPGQRAQSACFGT
jgi:hypothetical protein